MYPFHYAFVFCTLLLTACGGGQGEGEEGNGQQAPDTVSVRVAESVEEQLTFYDKYPGTVTALDEVEVRPQVAGYITQVHFREGDYVRKGQRLFTVDVRRYAADVDQAQSQVGTAQANLDLAEKNVARYRRLAEAEAIALQTLDQAEAEVTARRRDLESAEAGVRSARTQLDYTVIRAPLSGVTSLSTVKTGTQVSPGSPLLTTISQEEPIGVDFALPQEVIPRLSQLERGNGNFPDSTFRLRLPNDSIYDQYGSIYASDRAVDPRTGTLNVRLEFSNRGQVLRPGMSLQLEMINRQSGRQVMVPTRALGEQMGEYYVFVVEDSTAYRRKVSAGKRINGRAVIEEGLEGGQTIVTEGLKNVQDSTRVKILPEQKSGEAAQDTTASADKTAS